MATTVDDFDRVDRLISPRMMRKLLGIGRTTEDRRRRTDSSFPERLRVGPGSFAYRLSAVEKYISSRPGADIIPPPTVALDALALARSEKAKAKAKREQETAA